MNLNIRHINNSDVDTLIELAISAFPNVFKSFREILGPDIYEIIWPDWKEDKRRNIEALTRSENQTFTYVAEYDSVIVGLISYKLNPENRTGTIQYLAVHPDFQRQGIGTDLNEFALSKIKDSGMKLAIVETGGDESHRPARISYEKAGYTGLPLVRYFKKL